VTHGVPDESDRAHLEGADLVIAADGGALTLERWGVRPDLVVGDLDSLGAERAERLGAEGVPVSRFPAEKDESDTELAIGRAIAAGASEIVLVGAFGGERLDHELANALLLADGAHREIRLTAVRGVATVRALRGGASLTLGGSVGDLVTLLPVGGDAQGVRTAGLRYPLAGERLALGRSRALSNEVVGVPATVSCQEGVLLVIETKQRQQGGRT